MSALPSLSEFAARRIVLDRGRPHTDGLPKGPTAPPVVQLAGFLFRPIPFLEACRERYGEVLTMRLPATPPIVQFSDPAAVKQVFATSMDAMHAGKANQVLRPFLGKRSVLVLDGVEHRRERRLLMPPFRGERMRAYGQAMRDITAARITRWPLGETFRMQTETQAITLDVILRTVFGMQDGAEQASMRRNLMDATSIIDNPLFLIDFFQKDLGPKYPWGRFLRIRKSAFAEAQRLFAERRSENFAERDDILSMLLGATYDDGAPMTDEEIFDELMTLLVAGHETTATALSWTIHRLSRHRGILRAVQRELDEVFPDKVVDPERLRDLTYLDAVIKESLRIHPVIPGVGRVLMQPERVGGIDLPPGVMIGCSIYLSHMNPRVWPNPTRFDPERFVGQKPSPHTYFPFGGGIRRCIGEAFALYEMRAVLATMLMRLEPVPAPRHRVGTVRRNITLTPTDGLPIRFRRR